MHAATPNDIQVLVHRESIDKVSKPCEYMPRLLLCFGGGRWPDNGETCIFHSEMCNMECFLNHACIYMYNMDLGVGFIFLILHWRKHRVDSMSNHSFSKLINGQELVRSLKDSQTRRLHFQFRCLHIPIILLGLCLFLMMRILENFINIWEWELSKGSFFATRQQRKTKRTRQTYISTMNKNRRKRIVLNKIKVPPVSTACAQLF